MKSYVVTRQLGRSKPFVTESQGIFGSPRAQPGYSVQSPALSLSPNNFYWLWWGAVIIRLQELWRWCGYNSCGLCLNTDIKASLEFVGLSDFVKKKKTGKEKSQLDPLWTWVQVCLLSSEKSDLTFVAWKVRSVYPLITYLDKFWFQPLLRWCL